MTSQRPVGSSVQETTPVVLFTVLDRHDFAHIVVFAQFGGVFEQDVLVSVVFGLAYLDSVFPVVPSELCVIIGGVAAASSSSRYGLWLVIAGLAASSCTSRDLTTVFQTLAKTKPEDRKNLAQTLTQEERDANDKRLGLRPGAPDPLGRQAGGPDRRLAGGAAPVAGALLGRCRASGSAGTPRPALFAPRADRRWNRVVQPRPTQRPFDQALEHRLREPGRGRTQEPRGAGVR